MRTAFVITLSLLACLCAWAIVHYDVAPSLQTGRAGLQVRP